MPRQPLSAATSWSTGTTLAGLCPRGPLQPCASTVNAMNAENCYH
jgi:hypothetical protein